jgi:hypothetical protein
MLKKKILMFVLGVALAPGLAFGAGAPVADSAAAATVHTRLTAPAAQAARGRLTISTLPTKPSLVSGSEVLVRVEVPSGVRLPGVRVWLNGHDVTSQFRATRESTLSGLVTGLRLGRNLLQASARGSGGQAGELTIIDHPISGPVFSGPQQQPFICQTQTFALPTGGTLGPPLDSNCSAHTRIGYVYRSTDGTFKPLTDPSTLPSDVAQTTISTGQKVNYVVRVETGTINRAIYQIAILDDPTVDSTPTWYHHPVGWNGRLVDFFGGGCAPGYHQGYTLTAPFGGNAVTNNLWLSKGFAAVSSTLNIFGDNCNGVLSAETAMMVKEHFIDAYGVPKYTIGWGQSGGSMQQYLTAENYPGLLDGIVPQLSFPDTLTFFTPISDCHLLTHYLGSSSLSWTAAQEAGVEGWGNPDFCSTVSTSQFWALVHAGVTPQIPQATCNAPAFGPPVLSDSLIYDPLSNPTGARCDYWDNMVNVYGVDPATGFARRTIDNVGVQYGLDAFKTGQISAAQFLDLNHRIGGYDADGNIVGRRSAADPGALRIAYQTGRLDEGGGGLASVPIIDFRAYNDGAADPHDSVRTQTMRERLIRAHGTAANQIALEAPSDTTPAGAALFTLLQPMLLREMDQWLENISNDHAPATSTLAKIARDQPSDLVDACYTDMGVKVTDPGTCRQLYPVHANPRLAAGEPLTNDYLKCQLEPVRRADYAPMTDAQFAQLKAIFPSGVCDYSRPPVGQVPLKGTWLSYPSPGHSIPLNIKAP